MGSQRQAIIHIRSAGNRQSNMIKILLSFSTLILSINCAPSWLDAIIGAPPSDDKYNGYEQAPYTVTNNYGEFETRRYTSVHYACTEATFAVTEPVDDSQDSNEWALFGVINFVTRTRSKDDQSKMFWKLFQYIAGDNMEKQKIEMTVPVMTTMKKMNDGMMYKQMCFYIPKIFQSGPPAPTNPDVKIVKMEEMNVIVKRFGGYVMEDNLWMKHAQNFREEIESKGITGYDLSYFISAGYDSPMTLWNRRNEVIFQSL